MLLNKTLLPSFHYQVIQLINPFIQLSSFFIYPSIYPSLILFIHYPIDTTKYSSHHHSWDILYIIKHDFDISPLGGGYSCTDTTQYSSGPHSWDILYIIKQDFDISPLGTVVLIQHNTVQVIIVGTYCTLLNKILISHHWVEGTVALKPSQYGSSPHTFNA